MPPFDNDARMRELVYLAKLDRHGHYEDVSGLHQDSAHRRLILYLIEHGYVNDPSVTRWTDYKNVFVASTNSFLVRC